MLPPGGKGFLDLLCILSSMAVDDQILRCSIIFANMSVDDEMKASIGMNLHKILSCLIDMMRSGCDSTEKVQPYCATAICNFLSSKYSEDVIMGLVSERLVQDLIVLSILRVNATHIKEFMSKVLFNLLAIDATRQVMVREGVIDSLIRLTKQMPNL